MAEAKIGSGKKTALNPITTAQLKIAVNAGEERVLLQGRPFIIKDYGDKIWFAPEDGKLVPCGYVSKHRLSIAEVI